MFGQVDINLEQYKNVLQSLAAIREVQEAPELQEDWHEASKFWKTQPSKDTLSILSRSHLFQVSRNLLREWNAIHYYDSSASCSLSCKHS